METAAMTAAATRGGIWTEHQDTQGRTFYYNMAVGRSFWELPPELMALVRRPAAGGCDAEATGDTVAAGTADGLAAGDEETRRRRAQVLLQQQQQQQQTPVATAGGGVGRAALHERMAAAAQKQAKLRRAAGEKQQQQLAPREELAPPDASREYLEMVRQLQHVDRQTEASGSKWLVR